MNNGQPNEKFVNLLKGAKRRCLNFPGSDQSEGPFWNEEGDAIQTLQSIDQVWDNLFPAEQACIAKALSEQITVRKDGISIKWKSTGMTKLLRDSVMQQAYKEAA